MGLLGSAPCRQGWHILEMPFINQCSSKSHLIQVFLCLLFYAECSLFHYNCLLEFLSSLLWAKTLVTILFICLSKIEWIYDHLIQLLFITSPSIMFLLHSEPESKTGTTLVGPVANWWSNFSAPILYSNQYLFSLGYLGSPKSPRTMQFLVEFFCSLLRWRHLSISSLSSKPEYTCKFRSTLGYGIFAKLLNLSPGSLHVIASSEGMVKFSIAQFSSQGERRREIPVLGFLFCCRKISVAGKRRFF